MRRTVTATAAVAFMTAQLLLAQPMKPTAPGTPGDPKWQGIFRLADGRTFVTDGGLAIDASVARPAVLPSRELVPKVLHELLNASYKDECGLGDLGGPEKGRNYISPSGIALNATYVDFLRRALPAGSVRLRMNEKAQPILIVASGKAVGVLMPVKQ
jgi:hypothetical protein